MKELGMTFVEGKMGVGNAAHSTSRGYLGPPGGSQSVGIEGRRRSSVAPAPRGIGPPLLAFPSFHFPFYSSAFQLITGLA
jgi:hypothetical protein